MNRRGIRELPEVIIYTDGGCIPNPGVGGWAAVLQYGNHCKELTGAEKNTTNNRMELTAAVMALSALRKPCRVRLYTDSEYLRRGITEWLPEWKKAGWKRRSGSLKNIDLWKQLDILTQKHDIEWNWIQGHSGDPLNERCDSLVKREIKMVSDKVEEKKR